MSPLSASTASGMGSPTSAPAALFSATSRSAVAGSNTGALFPTADRIPAGSPEVALTNS